VLELKLKTEKYIMNITKESLRALSRNRERYAKMGWTIADIVDACFESEIESRSRHGRKSRTNLPYACRTSPHKRAKRAQLLVRCYLPRTEFPEDARVA
jgi:hypothetical protein